MHVSNRTLAAAAMATLLLGVASPAMATGNGGGLRGYTNPSSNSSSSTSSNSAATAQGGASNSSSTAQGGAGGNANATGGAGGQANATGGNATGGNATGGSASNANTNTANNNLSATNANTNSANNTNTAQGGAASADNNGNNNGNNGNNNSSSSNSQEQQQQQSQSLSNENDNSNSNNASQSVEVNSNYERPPVNTAYAASLTTSEDTCMGSSSVGAQGISFGISFGSTWRDANCRRLKNSRQLLTLGYQDAATALMCVDEDVREAMDAAGTPCPSQANRPVAQVRPAAFQPAPVPPPVACAPQDFAVYFEWDRSVLNREASEIIDAAVARARQCNANQALVIGHTDTSGSRDYNVALSRRRAAIVRDALVSRGLDAGLIRTDALGETMLARMTRDGVREPTNRRTAVTISFR